METFLLAFSLIAKACSCACNPPTVGYQSNTGSCICPCKIETEPFLNINSLTGPKGPGPYESPSSWNAPNWGINNDYDGFGWGGWGGWPVDFY